MTTETTEYRCPFCAGTDLRVLEVNKTSVNGQYGTAFVASCRKYECQSYGPLCDTKQAALEAFCNPKAYSERMKNENH